MNNGGSENKVDEELAVERFHREINELDLASIPSICFQTITCITEAVTLYYFYAYIIRKLRVDYGPQKSIDSNIELDLHDAIGEITDLQFQIVSKPRERIVSLEHEFKNEQKQLLYLFKDTINLLREYPFPSTSFTEEDVSLVVAKLTEANNRIRELSDLEQSSLSGYYEKISTIRESKSQTNDELQKYNKILDRLSVDAEKAEKTRLKYLEKIKQDEEAAALFLKWLE